MSESPMCKLCSSAMTKISTLDSGNSKYVTYRCQSCHAEKTTAVSVGK